MKITKMEMEMSETTNNSRIQQMRNNVWKTIRQPAVSERLVCIYVVCEKKRVSLRYDTSFLSTMLKFSTLKLVGVLDRVVCQFRHPDEQRLMSLSRF
jgi:hypothetical protein